MKYDFDTIIPRRGTNSYKWDTPEEENVLPMWVADMDFRTAPAIIDALQKRVAHGIFGYTKVPEAYYDAVVRWFDDRHRWQVDSRWIIYTSGVVPALSAIIKALAMPGDKVIVQTPAYNCFYWLKMHTRLSPCSFAVSSFLSSSTIVSQRITLRKSA